jgi:hypothetical protein
MAECQKFEGFRNISIGVAALLIPLVGHLFALQLKEQELNAKYSDIATKILLTPPAKQGGVGANKDLRTWAVDVLTEHGGIEISGQARKNLIHATAHGFSHWGASIVPITKAQKYLKADPYSYSGPVDGKDSEEFRDAILLFQQEHGLLADGIMGEQTAKKMRDLMSPGSSLPTNQPTK